MSSSKQKGIKFLIPIENIEEKHDISENEKNKKIYTTLPKMRRKALFTLDFNKRRKVINLS